MRRDRHGRAGRADADRRRRPVDGFRVAGARRFSALVEEALAELPDPLLAAVADAEVVVEDIPPLPAEAVVLDLPEVPLAAFTPATGGRGARLVVYRRPVEGRARDRVDLVDLLRAATGTEVARALGLGDEYDDLWDDWD